VTVLAPDAAKATTLDNQELVYASFPIEKWEDGPDGSVYVYGKASTPEVDTDEQIVDGDWSGKALQAWMDTGPNLRVQHNPQRDPAGSGLKVEVNRDGDGAHWVKSVVDEPGAVRLVKKGHLRAYSVGIARPTIVRDVTGKARGGIIKGGELAELSLVDRPANRSCSLQLVKAAKDGSADFTGKVFGAAGLLAAEPEPAAKAAKADGVTVTLPEDVSLSFSPKDLAKLVTFRQGLVTKGAAPAAPATKAATAGPDPLAAFKAAGDAEDAILGKGSRTFSAEVRRGYAKDQIALDDGSYPMPDADAVRRAAILIRSKHGDWKAAARLLARRVKALGIPNPLKAKATKAAEPVVIKCGCDNGMMDGKPCTSCKAGKRMARKAQKAVHAALEPDVAKGKGKLRALCSQCGAKQNKAHEFCTECGTKLPARPPMVAKNHDFLCLGCGHDLDKGEKHCPQCGKENPGYNPMADQKIPANEAAKAATPAGKDRVAKKAKKGKKAGKKEPFGGQQATPFGKDGDEKEPAAKKAAAKGMKPGKGKKRKGGHKPTPGEAGGVPGQHEKPAPPHREPDGAEIENFERDAHIEDGDDSKPTKLEARTMKGDPEAAAAVALKALGVPQHLGALHALTCPAYSPASVAKAFPHASFAAIDAAEWQSEALGKAASAPMDEAQRAMEVFNGAVTLKGADPYLLADLREQAHKAFRDANPGPGSFPEPGEIGPGRFNRPYLSAGHGAPSPGHDAPHHAKLPEVGGISAQDHTRPYISAGHADESPANEHRGSPMPAPEHTGVPTSAPIRQYMSSSAIESASHAMAIMHDHISTAFPDICSMQQSLHIAEHPVPVPHGVPQPSKAPGAKKAAKARKAAKVKARKAAKAMAAKRRKLESRVLKGSLSVDDARRKLGLQPIAPPQSPDALKAAVPVAAALDPDLIKAAIAEATAPLQAALKSAQKAQGRQDRRLRKQAKVLDAIASQPDMSASPMRGVALHKTASAAPAGPLTVSATAEQAQITKMQLLYHEMRNSPDSGQREAARAEYTRLLGVASMTPPANPMQT
jgi:Double zinc ribbon